MLLQAIGLAWVGLTAAPDLAYIHLVAPLIVAGCGVSMAMPAAQSAVLGAVTASEIGKASGAFNTLRFLGGVIGIAVAVAAFAHTGHLGSAQAFSAGFALAIEICAALSLAGAVAGMALPGRNAPITMALLDQNEKTNLIHSKRPLAG